MANCYIINYDLHNNRNYDELIEAIKSYGTWAKILLSCWAIVTTKSAEEVRNHLLQHMDSDDSIFVVKSGREAAWRGVICPNQWLKDNL
jgi:hypothetical protein